MIRSCCLWHSPTVLPLLNSHDSSWLDKITPFKDFFVLLTCNKVYLCHFLGSLFNFFLLWLLTCSISSFLLLFTKLTHFTYLRKFLSQMANLGTVNRQRIKCFSIELWWLSFNLWNDSCICINFKVFFWEYFIVCYVCFPTVCSDRWDQRSQLLFTVFTVRLGHRVLKCMVRYLFWFIVTCLNDDSFIPMYFITCMTPQ